MEINIKLDTRSTKMAIRNLKRYQEQLNAKCELFVSKLIDIGIKTAKLNCGEYGDKITFSREIGVYGGSVKGAVGKLVAVGTPTARLRGGEEVMIDPLLMAEFGSGWNAKVLDKVDGVGQGTFPGQTHAFDPTGWWYTDIETGKSEKSYGEEPTYPMHSAMVAMIFDIDKVIKEVFGNGKR